ncbi:hypothetical protein ACQX0N_01755 [Clostridium tepidum]|jgi:hypothetical protein|nr:hypothetical protein [Clostridium tepidum]MCR1933356.1 hypothetical protein [Clostridium tepidum]MDU6878247.1 hypothetical protein [Clostridium botulinum]
MAKKHKKKTIFRILLSTLAIGSIFLASNSKEDTCNVSKDEYDQCNAK